MVIPMSLPQQYGAPTAWALGMRPWLRVLLVLQIAVCILQIGLLLDIWGGFIAGVTIGVGWYATNQNMDITFISMYGLMCLVNGVLDTVRVIDTGVKMHTA